MSPRRPHLRNRKRIKAPRRFEDEDIMDYSPRQESHEESEESSELEEETYKSPKPKKPKSKAPAYHGKVTEFNPNLPPAAFPTLDHPDYVHNGGNIAVDLELHFPELQSREPKLAASEPINSGFLGHGRHREHVHVTEGHPTITSITADVTHWDPRTDRHIPNMVKRPHEASIPSSIYGESTDNGPRNPIWASNMARMEAAGKMSDLDRNILEMESSDEEDSAARPTKRARTASVPDFPAWEDLTVAHKLDLADAIAEIYPDPAQVMHQLRLSVSEKEELVELLKQREDREAEEEKNRARLQEQTKDVLLQGRRLSQSTFHQMVEDNLYGITNEEDHLQTNLMELKKARAYLRYCGFDPTLADSSWDVPSISNAASGTNPKPAKSKPKTRLPNTAAQTPPRPSDGPFSRPPALSIPQKVSYPPDPRLGLIKDNTQGALAQHRPTSALALITQHSPAAPLSKVPMQSYRVASGNQNGDLRARHQGTVHIPQPTLPVSSVQPDAATSPDLQTIHNRLQQACGASSSLPTPQEERSLPAHSHHLALKDLPASRKYQHSQSSGNMKDKASASQGTGGVLGNGDLVNKKKRKKSAT